MLRMIGWLTLKVYGWRYATGAPTVEKAVVIAAPHTSNWDFVFTLGILWALRMKANWLGKHTMFSPPFGGVMRWMGGIPVNRSGRNNAVDSLAAEFARRPHFQLLVPAEGTRRRTDYWKSGFYQIAMAAGVPIIPAYLDYAKKEGGFGPPIMPTGDVKADMDRFRAFYQGITGKFPDQFGPVRLKEEHATPEAAAAREAK